MVKIQAQAGSSLADVYDVRGSIAGIDQLETNDLPIVHEMGATVFSERLVGRLNRGTSGAIAQNTTFDIDFASLVENEALARVVGISVWTDAAARLVNVAWLLVDDRDGREIPVWAWDSVNGISVITRLSNQGAAAANVDLLIPIFSRLQKQYECVLI